ncbi:MAG TPA: secretin N-terminal domain-containing protein [Candidatus Deferrimicrobium sp.]|nr:secretin N-terminal domain-containing protein [Candidatus Deferrimicrobium sp.]
MTRKPFPMVLLWLGVFLAVSTFQAGTLAQEQHDPGAPIRNLQFQSADIRSVLTFLADYGGVNVVIAPNVQGTVTIKLTNVMWRAAMDIIGRTYELAIVDEPGGYLRVMPADAYRKEVTEQEKHRADQVQLASLETRIVKISNSTSDDIVKAVQSLLTGRGIATSDPRSNSIIIQEVPENLPKVLGYVAELDKPARQIKISAQLLEIWSTDLQELGINWSVDASATLDEGHEHSHTAEVLADRVSDPVGQYNVTVLPKGTFVNTIEAKIQALVNNRKGKIIAHPEITTVDNKEAKIQMGQKIPVKQFDEAGNVVIRFEEVGTILRVTPHVTAENQILMNLKPERSTYEFDPNGVIINTSNAATTVIVSSGQTAVIGGLTTEDQIETEVGVPILKDIPVVGYLFKYTNERMENRDLVIFVTPTIVEQELAQER